MSKCRHNGDVKEVKLNWDFYLVFKIFLKDVNVQSLNMKDKNSNEERRVILGKEPCVSCYGKTLVSCTLKIT